MIEKSDSNMTKDKIKISVICVYNDKALFNKQLMSSLKEQDVEYEFIAIENEHGSYNSAAAALNSGASASHGDILIFSHQDIYFKTEKELRKLAERIDSVDLGDIVGTQGTKEPNKYHYANLTSGAEYNAQINHELEDTLYEVSCVDEGLFGMRKATWEAHHFDEELCNNWHLYCVELCLNARKNGHKVFVYPSQIHHFSKGTISLGYMKNLKRLCKSYRKDFKYIWTTCYKVRTNVVYINCLVFAWYINRILHGNLI